MLLTEQHRWRISLDQDKAWVIVGKSGVVSQFPDGDLDVWLMNLRRSRQVEAAGWKAKNHYDDGALFIRPTEDLDQACRWIRAKKRRVMSPKQLAHLQKVGFKKASHTTEPILGVSPV